MDNTVCTTLEIPRGSPPPKLLFHMNSWFWLTLHNCLNPLKKQQPVSVSPRPYTPCLVALGLALAPTSRALQLGFTWESPSPAQVAAISDCSIAQAGWPWAKHRWRLILACTTQETPEPAHPVDSYRPCWCTTILLLHG